MVRHGMIIIKDATKKLNPGQIHVMEVEQPLLRVCDGQGQKHLVSLRLSLCCRGLLAEMGSRKIVGNLL